MQGMHVTFFKENGESCTGVVIYYDAIERQVIVQDKNGGEWVGKPEQVFERKY